MLKLTTTVEKLIDYALLQLWYADYWERMTDMPERIKKENVTGFRSQADGIAQFIYQEVISGDSLVDYKGIKVPQNHLPYYQEREKHFIHPNQDDFPPIKN